MKEFGEILKELRINEKLSQAALADIIHVSRSAIAKYENGLGLPSEEVIQALCRYFKVDKDYLFPKENVEQLITEKNIIINNQKRRYRIITLSLLLIIITLIPFLIISGNENKQKVKLDDVELSIDIEEKNIFQESKLLLKYDGGYVYQTLEIHKFDFTDLTNLYLIRVSNTYVNGNTAYLNGEVSYNSKEYTESVYMEMDFSINQNYNPITSWHQKKSNYFLLTSELNANGKIILDNDIDLFDGSAIQKKNDNFMFVYDCQITDWLFDYDYNNILRKCIINNDKWNSNWSYEMIDEVSKSQAFTICSSYLIESKSKEQIDFNIISKMNNTNMIVEQKQNVILDI